MNRDFIETAAGILLMVAALHGCGALSDLAAQCDGKWRGFEHAASCSHRLASEAKP